MYLFVPFNCIRLSLSFKDKILLTFIDFNSKFIDMKYSKDSIFWPEYLSYTEKERILKFIIPAIDEFLSLFSI
jgi:hypothetical protein